MVQIVRIVLEEKYLSIWCSPYHGWWWSGNARNYGISSLAVTQIHQIIVDSESADLAELRFIVLNIAMIKCIMKLIFHYQTSAV